MKYILLIDREDWAIHSNENEVVNVFAWENAQDKLIESCVSYFKWSMDTLYRILDNPRFRVCEFKDRKSYETGKRKFNRLARLGSYQGLVQPYNYDYTLNEFQKDMICTEYERGDSTIEKIADDWAISEREVRRIIGISDPKDVPGKPILRPLKSTTYDTSTPRPL